MSPTFADYLKLEAVAEQRQAVTVSVIIFGAGVAWGGWWAYAGAVTYATGAWLMAAYRAHRAFDHYLSDDRFHVTGSN